MGIKQPRVRIYLCVLSSYNFTLPSGRLYRCVIFVNTGIETSYELNGFLRNFRQQPNPYPPLSFFTSCLFYIPLSLPHPALLVQYIIIYATCQQQSLVLKSGYMPSHSCPRLLLASPPSPGYARDQLLDIEQIVVCCLHGRDWNLGACYCHFPFFPFGQYFVRSVLS